MGNININSDVSVYMNEDELEALYQFLVGEYKAIKKTPIWAKYEVSSEKKGFGVRSMVFNVSDKFTFCEWVLEVEVYFYLATIICINYSYIFDGGFLFEESKSVKGCYKSKKFAKEFFDAL